MPSEKTGLAREFQPIEDRAEALRILKEGARTVASVMIWTANQSQVIHSHISMLSEVDAHLLIRVPNDFAVRDFEDALDQKGTRECFFSVSLVAANIFFKTKYVGTEEGELAFSLPETVYKVQRRSNLRFPIPDGHVLPVAYAEPGNPGKTTSRKVFDLSAGGLSFLVPPDEVAQFTREQVLQQLSFTINQRKIVVDAQVRHISSVPEQQWKGHPSLKEAARVGVQFMAMRPADNHALAAYVFEESRKFFTRFA